MCSCAHAVSVSTYFVIYYFFMWIYIYIYIVRTLGLYYELSLLKCFLFVLSLVCFNVK